jgi:PAS domain-containing protein
LPPFDLFAAGPQAYHHVEFNGLDINEQLNLLRQALLLSQANVVLANRDLLQFLDCSPAAHKRLGYSREEYLALGPFGLQAEPEHDAAWLKRQVALLHREGEHSFHTRHRSSNGGCADLEVHLQLVACGSRQLALVTHHEPSDWRSEPGQDKRLNQLLLDAEQLSQLGSWELDHRSGELIWSKGTFWIFETDALSFIPSYEGFLAMVHPQDRDLVDQTYRMSLQTRQPYQMNHRICLADGRQKVVEERGTASYDEAGNPLRSIGTVQDISKLAEA